MKKDKNTNDYFSNFKKEKKQKNKKQKLQNAFHQSDNTAPAKPALTDFIDPAFLEKKRMNELNDQ